MEIYPARAVVSPVDDSDKKNNNPFDQQKDNKEKKDSAKDEIIELLAQQHMHKNSSQKQVAFEASYFPQFLSGLFSLLFSKK
ncbi:MAG: hypothetical protein JW769_04225 [Parachlamydiales bacterium]|nr:hypothetical protein [Parachlamydiales bacterium]